MLFDPNDLCYEMMRIYSENKTPENKIVIMNEGGTRCFASDQKIITNNGSIKISDLKVNDKVLSFNHTTGNNEYRKVLSCIKKQNTKKAYCIRFKDGSVIKCTFDHEFFYHGRYIIIEKLLLSLNKK